MELRKGKRLTFFTFFSFVFCWNFSFCLFPNVSSSFLILERRKHETTKEKTTFYFFVNLCSVGTSLFNGAGAVCSLVSGWCEVTGLTSEGALRQIAAAGVANSVKCGDVLISVNSRRLDNLPSKGM